MKEHICLSNARLAVWTSFWARRCNRSSRSATLLSRCVRLLFCFFVIMNMVVVYGA